MLRCGRDNGRTLVCCRRVAVCFVESCPNVRSRLCLSHWSVWRSGGASVSECSEDASLATRPRVVPSGRITFPSTQSLTGKPVRRRRGRPEDCERPWHADGRCEWVSERRGESGAPPVGSVTLVSRSPSAQTPRCTPLAGGSFAEKMVEAGWQASSGFTKKLSASQRLPLLSRRKVWRLRSCACKDPRGVVGHRAWLLVLVSAAVHAWCPICSVVVECIRLCWLDFDANLQACYSVSRWNAALHLSSLVPWSSTLCGSPSIDSFEIPRDEEVWAGLNVYVQQCGTMCWANGAKIVVFCCGDRANMVLNMCRLLVCLESRDSQHGI